MLASVFAFATPRLAGAAQPAFVAFAGMLAPQLEGVRGLLQRCAEAALFLGILAASVQLGVSGAGRVAPGERLRPNAASGPGALP